MIGAASDLPPPRSAWVPVDRLMLIRLLYLAVYGAMPLMNAFGSLVYESRGFAASGVGWLMAVPPLCTLVLAPPVATFAETRNLQTPLIILCGVLSAIAVVGLTNSTWHPLIIACAVAFGASSRPATGMIDEHAMAVIGPSRKADWGGFRVFGAYGWAACSMLISVIGGHYGWGAASAVYVAGFGVGLWCIYQTPVERGAPGTHHYGDVLRRLAGRPRVFAFFVGVSVMGVGSTLIGTYLFLYLQTLGATPALFGFCVIFTVAVEIPLFRNSAAVYARFTDAQLLAMAMLAWAIRTLGYSLLSNPWYVLALEPLHGLTFGLTWLSGMRFFPSAFPKSFSNSSISLLYAGQQGIGPILGNVVGGYVFVALGPRLMYRCAALLFFAVAVAFYAVYERLPAISIEDVENGHDSDDKAAAAAVVVADADEAGGTAALIARRDELDAADDPSL